MKVLTIQMRRRIACLDWKVDFILSIKFPREKEKETWYFERERGEEDTEVCQQNIGDVSMIFSELERESECS